MKPILKIINERISRVRWILPALAPALFFSIAAEAQVIKSIAVDKKQADSEVFSVEEFDDPEFENLVKVYKPGLGALAIDSQIQPLSVITGAQLVDYLTLRATPFLNSPLVNPDLSRFRFSEAQVRALVDLILYIKVTTISDQSVTIESLASDVRDQLSARYPGYADQDREFQTQVAILNLGEAIVYQALSNIGQPINFPNPGFMAYSLSFESSAVPMGGWLKNLPGKIRDLWDTTRFIISVGGGLSKAGKGSRIVKIASRLFKIGKTAFKWSPWGFVADALLCSAENIFDGIDMFMGASFAGMAGQASSGTPVSSVLGDFLGEAGRRLWDELRCMVSPI